jgi:hypothetical protein
MHHRLLRYSFFLLLVFALGFASKSASQKRRNTEPKPEIAPLPKELPKALAAETARLEFHSLPLLTTGGLAAQIRQSVNILLRETKNETVVKLRAFVAGPGDARRVQATVTNVFSDHKLPLPVVSIVQVGALQEDRAQIAMEATVSTKKPANPNGLVFLGGQTSSTLAGAVAKLQESARAAGGGNILRCTCFTSRLDGQGESLHKTLESAFPGAALTVVQALRDPPDDSATCEAVGQLPATASQPSSPLTLLPEARAMIVHSDRLVFTGLQLTFGNYLDDAQEAFERLRQAAAAVEEVEAPVQVNAFSPDPASMAALRKMTNVPLSVFTLQPVEGLPGVDASAGVEEVLAPGIAAPVIAGR